MKYIYVLIIVVGLYFLQCKEQDHIDDEVNCIVLFNSLDSATLFKVAGLELYSKDPSIENCEYYKEALQYRIAIVEDLISADCFTTSLPEAYFRELIKEDQEEIESLNC